MTSRLGDDEPPLKLATCPECDGHGLFVYGRSRDPYDDEEITCAACDGHGTVVTEATTTTTTEHHDESSDRP